MTMIDAGASDDKVIAVATNDPEFNGYVEARDLPPHRLLVLKRFFSDYKQLEGKKVEVEDIRPAYAAVTAIERALARYQAERERLIGKLAAKESRPKEWKWPSTFAAWRLCFRSSICPLRLLSIATFWASR